MYSREEANKSQSWPCSVPVSFSRVPVYARTRSFESAYEKRRRPRVSLRGLRDALLHLISGSGRRAMRLVGRLRRTGATVSRLCGRHDRAGIHNEHNWRVWILSKVWDASSNTVHPLVNVTPLNLNEHSSVHSIIFKWTMHDNNSQI